MTIGKGTSGITKKILERKIKMKNGHEEENNVKTLMKYSGLSRARIYEMAKKIGRLPTREEIDNRPKVGRPKKYN